MATGFRKILEGLRLIPKAASTASEKGDLDVVTSSGKLNYHNGTSASPVVTEDHSATLTNKTIDGDNNTVQNLGLGSLKTVLADADKVIRRDAAGVVTSGNSLPNSSQIVTLDSSDTLSNKILNTIRTVKSTPTNTAGALALPSTGYALVSANINTIAAGSDGSVIILTNTSASAIVLANESSGAGDGIRTGSGGSISLLPKASLVLVYNSTAPGYWYVVGGVGGGGGSEISSITIDNGDFGPYTGNFDFQFGGGLNYSIIGSSPTAGVQVINPYYWYTFTTSTNLVLTPGSLSSKDAVILANASASSITITLPNAVFAATQRVTIKRTDVNTTNNTVLINTSGGTIDGQPSISINKYLMSYTIMSDGTNYWII